MNNSNKRRTRLIFTALAIGLCVFLISAARDFIPERSTVGSITASDEDDHPVLSVPTVGPVVRYNRDAPRYYTIWAGRADLTRLTEWQAEVSARAESIESELMAPWPTEIVNELPSALRDAPFIRQGESYLEWRATRNGKYYVLRVNWSTGAFTLTRLAEDE
jgi:hypothetical protein